MIRNLPYVLVQFALIVGAALALTCVEPQSVECPSGRVCPNGTVCAAAQDVCIANGCGDSVVDPGEVCDDGNVRNGDGCSLDCQSDETCGNDVVDGAAGEVCDDGNTVSGDDCSDDCESSEVCGNNILDTAVGEVCDDDNNTSGDGCRADCISDETCGNALIDTAVGEACDDGNTLDGDECSSDCSAGAGCGNGFVDDGEICDDGNQDDDDGCSANCLSNETCGNGTPDFAAGEICDDGNTDSGDGCRADCHSNETCGNGQIDPDDTTPGPEQCDDGGAAAGGGCSATCQFEVCGNGFPDPNEACDDGNLSNGPCADDPTQVECADTCDPVTPANDPCPAGFFCSDVTLRCNGLDFCSLDCLSASQGCGNAVRDSNEECDDGTPTDTIDDYEDDCITGDAGEPVRCRLNVCGDGFQDKVGPDQEACDGDGAGAGGQTAGCNVDCTLPDCGDGILNTLAGEDCDDGGEVHGDGCSATCVVEPYTLGVFRFGNGTGTVTSSTPVGPPGINCGTACSEQYVAGAVVTLDATVGTNSVFTGWAGPCTGTTTCSVTMTDNQNLLAVFELNRLTVAKGGTGTGTVTGTGGINCGATCTADYPGGTSVTLVAAPSGDSSFFGWSGGGCTGTGNCVTTMSGAKTVTATFNQVLFDVAVTKTGAGTGTVTSTSSPSQTNINCGGSCTRSFISGTTVTLTATPTDANHTFTGWSGVAGCPGTGTCVVTIDAAKSVTATFGLVDRTLTTTVVGQGTVTSSPSGVSCSNASTPCTNDFAHGTAVVLSAAAANGFVFTGWTATGCSGTGTCSVTMDAAKSVTATFTEGFDLTVLKTGAGTGTVTSTSSPSQTNINCGPSCVRSFTSATTVTLTGTPTDVNNTFTGWSGVSGCTTTAPCVVTMDAAKTVTATFGLVTRTLSTTVVGQGTVTSEPALVSCSSGTCADGFAHGTVVVLSATPASGFAFTGWTATGCSGTGTCSQTMTADRSVTATFTRLNFTLSVVKNGTGTGTVTSTSNPTQGSQINCGGTCSRAYPSATVVTLSTSISGQNTFLGWTVDDGSLLTCPGTTCAVTMDQAHTVTATFGLTQRQLTVNKTGTGSGTVTSEPAGITCGGACTTTFDHGTGVTLTAVADATATFNGWSGDCSGTGTCNLNMTAAKTVTANFVLIDIIAPTVTINQASGQADPTSALPINFTVTFSEAVTGFTGADVTLSGTAGNLGGAGKTVTGGPTIYNVAVGGVTTDGTVTATVPAGGAQDTGSNTNLASTSTDNTVTRDTTDPTVTINQASGQADPTSALPINFTVTFNEAVTGFTNADVTLSGTAGNLGGATITVTGGPSIYNVAVSGVTTDGTVIATIPSGRAQDAAGQSNLASTSTDNTVTRDTTAPTVTINQASGQADPASALPINFTVTFSQAVTGFTDADVTLSGTAGGTATIIVTGGPSIYNVAVGGVTDGTVIATVPAGGAQDAASNNNTASTSTDNTVTLDATAPTVTINQASGQADPTSALPINFTVTFSEAVTGFTNADVTLSGTAGLGGASKTVTGGPTIYNVAVGGVTTDGTVIATVPAGGAQDGASNTNTASTSTDNTVTRDTTDPTVTINQASGQADPTSALPINFTVTFSEAVIGFTDTDVTLSGTAGLGGATIAVTGGPSIYNVAVSGVTTDGTVIATVPAGGVLDAAGNANTVSTSTDNTVTRDTTAPTVTINQASGQADPTSVQPINFTVTFSEAVTGFTDLDVALTGPNTLSFGTVIRTVTGGPSVYNVAVSGVTGTGFITATVSAAGAQDAAGNTNTASTSTDNTVTLE